MSILGNNLLAQYYAQNQGLPFGYEAVEYLESNGGSYIDVGVKWGIYDWEVQFSCLGDFRFGVGHQGYSRGTWNRLELIPNASSTTYFWKTYTDKYSFSRLSVGDIVTISCTQGLYINGINKYKHIFSEGTDNTININMLLFACYDFKINAPEVAKMKHCDFLVKKITGTPLRNLISCVRKSDGKPGMYDLCRSICPLTGTPFYINAGTGEFVTP